MRETPGWREDWESDKKRALERQKCEIDAERKQREARKAREAETASTNWYAAVDGRIHEHLANWLWAAIDQRVEQLLKQHFFSGKLGVGGAVIGGLTDAVGEMVGKLKRTIEEQQRAFEAKLVALEGRQALSNQAIEATLAHERDVLIEATGGAQLRAEVKRSIEELCSAFGVEIAALEQRLRAVPGKLPVAKTWCPEAVTYQGEVVSYDGASYQALRDTAQMPGGSDWICVAARGVDAVTPKTCGAFNAHKTYMRLNIVEYDGASYAARRDAPGVPGIPGDGWQLVSRSGRRGATGETGPRGRKGEKGEKGDAPEIAGWHLERKTYRAFPIFADGRMGPELNLRPLFEQFVEETSYAVEARTGS